MHSNKPTERFSHTVTNYQKYRPSYPQAIIELLIKTCQLSKSSQVADIGSGTGIFTRLLLEKEFVTYAIEPNGAMRKAAEDGLNSFSNFHSIDATAEATTLTAHSIDLITAATAFHWFNLDKVKPEFKRILKPDGWIAIIFNIRDVTAAPIMQAYEDILLRYGVDYQKVAAKNRIDQQKLQPFFYPNEIRIKTVNHHQSFDFTGLKGRLLSTSYAPKPGTQNYELAIKALEQAFNQFQDNGKINFHYCAKLYLIKLEKDF